MASVGIREADPQAVSSSAWDNPSLGPDPVVVRVIALQPYRDSPTRRLPKGAYIARLEARREQLQRFANITGEPILAVTVPGGPMELFVPRVRWTK